MVKPEKSDFKRKNFIFNITEGNWVIEDEEEYMNLVEYKFPDDAGCTPFSANLYYHHFIFASGFTYLGDYDDFKNPYKNDKVGKAIPAGYKSILILERICLFNNGEIVFNRELPTIKNSSNKYIGKYVVFSSKLQRYTIPSWGRHELVTSQVKVNVENKLYIDAVQDLDLAKSIAKEYSIKDNARCIVCTILDDVNWH